MSTKHFRHGIGSVRPYLYGDLKVAELIKHAFGAQELERLPVGNHGFHIEVKIGDSMLVLEAGAASIAAPADKPYQERACGVTDSYGNTWWIATYTG